MSLVAWFGLKVGVLGDVNPQLVGDFKPSYKYDNQMRNLSPEIFHHLTSPLGGDLEENYGF